MTKLGLHLAGPGFPRPFGRRRTFIEWTLNAIFRGSILTLSLSVLFIAWVAACVLLGVVLAIF